MKTKKLFSKTFIAAVIALFVGFGSVFGGQGLIRAMNPGTADEENTQEERQISHQRMLLDNLMAMGTFKVDGGIDFTLEDETMLNVGLNVDGDIADFNDIKLQGDASLYLNGINLSADFSYMKEDKNNQEDKGTIYFSYKENNFYLETQHILDFIDMLPSEYGIELNLPDELKNLDLITITNKIEGMEEKESTNGDIYFVLPLSETIDLFVKSDKDYNFKGIRTDEITYKGNKIKLNFDLAKTDDVEFVVPNKAQYQNFKPIFNIFKSVYNFINEKQNNLNIAAKVEKFDETSEQYNAFVDADIDLGYDVEAKSFQAEATLHENDRNHVVGLLYEDDTAYLDIRATKISIEFSTITSTLAYIGEQFNLDFTGKIMDMVSELISSDKLTSMREGIKDLVGAIQIDENSFSIELDLDALGLDMGKITPVITFGEDHLESISIHDLKIKGYKASVDLTFGSYIHRDINKEEYVAFEPALTIIEAIIPLLDQKDFRIEFNALVESSEAGVKDITVDGGLQFNISEQGFGYGQVTIVDRDEYRHNIKADMKTKDEFLFSYNDTLNGKFSSKTLKELYSLVSDIINNPDEHFIELFGELMEGMKNTPIGRVLDGDYLALLETQLINSIEIDETHIHLNVSLAIIGMDDKSIDVDVFYHADYENEKAYLDGVKISNFVIDNTTITFEAFLKEFDPSKESERLDPYQEYLDFSDIKVLLQLGVNTSKFEYFHFSATLNLNFKIIVDINKDIAIDIKIRNNKGKVQVAAEIDNIPIINIPLVLNLNANKSYTSTNGRSAAFYFDEDTIYTKRVDDVKDGLIFAKNYYVTYGATYDTDYFLDNIAEIMLRDLLGVNEDMMDDIIGNTSSEQSSTQIEYEKILKDFKFDSDAGKFTFKIDLYSLTHVSLLQTLDLIVYEDKQTEQLSGLEIKTTVHLLININIKLSLTTVEKDTELKDSNRITALENWAASREGAAKNSFVQISKVKH